jgi:hypothetical protein
MTSSHSQGAWYDCDCQASHSQLYGCDWTVGQPDYRVSVTLYMKMFGGTGFSSSH